MPVLTGSVHAHILTKPSRAGFVVIRLELIEPGPATCVYNEARPRERSDRGRSLDMPGPFIKSLDSCIYMNPTHGPLVWSLDDRSRLPAGGREQWTVLSGTSAIGHGLHVADRAQGLGHIYTSIYYCCKSFPVLLHDVIVGGWIASYVFIFIFWSRCCCCCCVLLLLPHQY